MINERMWCRRIENEIFLFPLANERVAVHGDEQDNGRINGEREETKKRNRKRRKKEK